MSHLPTSNEILLERALDAYNRRSPDGYSEVRQLVKELLGAVGSENKALRGRALHILGATELREWDLVASKAHLHGALQALEHDSDPVLLAPVHDTCGQLYESLGDYAHAVSHYVCSLAMKARSNDRFGVGVTLNNVGRLHCKHEEWDAARRLLRERLDIARELEDAVGIVFSGGLLAVAMARSGDTDGGLAMVAEAIERAREHRMGLQLALTLKCRAEVELIRGEAEAARSSAGEGLEVIRGLGTIEGAAHLRRVRGEAHAALGNHEAALEDLTHAVDALRADEDVAEEVHALNALSAVKSQLRRSDEALAAVDRALMLARRHGMGSLADRLARRRQTILLEPGSLELNLHIEWSAREVTLTVGRHDNAPQVLDLRIRHEIDRGGFGIVYLVEDTASGGEYALKKLILDDRGDSSANVQRFRAEAFAAARLRHESIVKVFNIAADSEKTPYLLMEYLPGGTLKDQRPSWRRAFEVGAMVADALDEVHGAGIVHRDIKPGNILFRENGDPVLTDFGIAHLPESSMTMTGEFLGSLHYAAPEMVNFSKGEPKSDVFSLGVCLYEAIEGVRPYVLSREEGGWFSFFDEPPRPALEPELTEPAKEALFAMLEIDPAARPTAARARDLLRGCL